jgi:hypothetical protein
MKPEDEWSVGSETEEEVLTKGALTEKKPQEEGVEEGVEDDVRIKQHAK